jgi:hypothetical protein
MPRGGTRCTWCWAGFLLGVDELVGFAVKDLRVGAEMLQEGDQAGLARAVVLGEVARIGKTLAPDSAQKDPRDPVREIGADQQQIVVFDPATLCAIGPRFKAWVAADIHSVLVVNFFEAGFVADVLDALLRGDDLIVSCHDGNRAELETLRQMHGADREPTLGNLHLVSHNHAPGNAFFRICGSNCRRPFRAPQGQWTYRSSSRSTTRSRRCRRCSRR